MPERKWRADWEVDQPVPAATLHPDDGHEHRFTCIRCGVDPAPTAPAGLREAYLRGYDDGRADRAILNDPATPEPVEGDPNE